jgi:hypothetical protein
MRFLLPLLAASCGCSKPPAPMTPPIVYNLLQPIRALPVGPEQTAKAVDLVRAAQPVVGIDFDTLSAEFNPDRTTAPARYQDRVVVIVGARVERAWSAKEDAQGIATVQVKSSDGMLSWGLRFAPDQEARVLQLNPGKRITASCLMLGPKLQTPGCVLLID